MLKHPFLAYSMIAECVFCAALVGICWQRRLIRRHKFVVALAAVWCIELTICSILLFFRQSTGLSIADAYRVYVYNYWICDVLSYGLTLGLIYKIFRQTMVPFRGLQRLGTMVFLWVSGVSLAVTLWVTLVPARASFLYLTAFVQLGQSINILTICLLMFVCFSAHYLGMTFRTRLFGISLGLGIQGCMSLLLYAWICTHGVAGLYSSVNAIPAYGTMLTVGIWGTYFLLPEPVQKMVLLPTTSPYFHWNQVSEALGSSPGMVAVAGFTPEMLSGAERSMLGAAAKRGGRKPVVRVDVAAAQERTGALARREPAVAMPR